MRLERAIVLILGSVFLVGGVTLSWGNASAAEEQLPGDAEGPPSEQWIHPSTNDDQVRKAKRALRGVWVMESQIFGGRARAVEDGMGLEFTEDKLIPRGDRDPGFALYEIDPTQVPAAFDQLFPQPADPRRRGRKGIYKIDGDQLTICLGNADRRPESFAAGPNVVLFVLRRQTEDDRRVVQEAIAAVREELQSAEKLKRLGSALHEFAAKHGHLPTTVLDSPRDNPQHQGTEPHSWRVALLPFLGHRELYDQYDFDEPWDGPSNRKLISKMPAVYRHPSDAADMNNTAYFMFTGPATIQDGRKDPAFRQIVDGTANTALLAETRRDVPWTKPEDITYHPDQPLPAIGGYYEGTLFLGLADGTPVLLRSNAKENVIRELIEKADGVWPDWRSYEQRLPRPTRVR